MQYIHTYKYYKSVQVLNLKFETLLKQKVQSIKLHELRTIRPSLFQLDFYLYPCGIFNTLTLKYQKMRQKKFPVISMYSV